MCLEMPHQPEEISIENGQAFIDAVPSYWHEKHALFLGGFTQGRGGTVLLQKCASEEYTVEIKKRKTNWSQMRYHCATEPPK